MRIDERRRQHEPGGVEDPVPVAVEPFPDLGDVSTVDPNVDDRVEPLVRVDHARSSDHEAFRALTADEDHATSIAASTSTGPVVRRS